MTLIMQKEIQNSRPDWKNRLDHLEETPSEGTWNKLYAKLENKPQRKKAVWWYLAAACILFVFVLFSVFKDNKPETNDVVTAPPKTEVKITLLLPPSIKKEKVLTKKKVHFPRRKEQNFPIEITQPDVIVPQENISLTAIEVPQVVPRKKLRVVHINELEPAAVGEGQDVADSEKPKAKRGKNKKLIHSYVSNSNSDKLLKINLSPSN
jgi:hypothetical protein